jgi:hypothetical protein
MDWFPELTIRLLLTIICFQGLAFFWFVWIALKYVSRARKR